MNATEQKIIQFDSPEAAELKTITGWVSSDGRFFGNDERTARFAGCTHLQCKCGNQMQKGYTMCDFCRAKAEREKYNEMPFKEWDEENPVYSEYADKYFFNVDDILDYCDDQEEDLKPEELQLIICEPNEYFPVEYDYWEDIMPEDGDLPKALEDALDTLNNVIKTLQPCSWYPGKFRTEYKGEQES